MQIDSDLQTYRISKLLPPGMSFPDVDAAPICLNALLIENVQPQRQDVFAQIVAQHYAKQFVGEAYKIVGSVSALGNPVGLVDSMGTGVKDFFYEPAQALMTSPNAFGTAMGRGTKSLFTHTASGLSDSTSKLIGGIGSGFAALSMDDDFEEKQDRLAHARGSAGDSLAAGAEALGDGFKDGFAGILEKPTEGAQADGMSGFFKGVGKGLTGAVTKPLAGVFGAMAGVTGAVKAGLATSLVNLQPIRLRRAMLNDVVTVYDQDAATAMNILAHHLEMPEETMQAYALCEDGTLILTGHSIIFSVKVQDIGEDQKVSVVDWKLQWAVEAEDIKCLSLEGVPPRLVIQLDNQAQHSGTNDDSSSCLLEPCSTCSAKSTSQLKVLVQFFYQCYPECKP